MKKCILTGSLVLAVLCAGAAPGLVNADDDATAKALAKIADLGKGVHKIKKDDKGNIISCVIVGEAEISTVLGKTRGIQTARTKARLSCAAEFRKFLKEKVRVYEGTSSEEIILREGKEDGKEDGGVKEAGKAVDKTTTKYETIASGLVRGLRVLHVEVKADDKNYILVMGWDAATSAATKKVAEDLKDGKPGKTDKGGTPGKKVDKKLENKKATSEDAKKFID
jgi:hypothetical protein